MNIIFQRLSTALICSILAVASVDAMDIDTYVEVAKQAANTAKKGKAKDVDKLLAQQEELIRLGVEGALKYAEENPARRKMMHLLVLNSERMKHLSLDAMETAWHNGDYLRRNGIEIGNLAHTDAAMSYYYAIIHPAAAFIALTEYKNSKDPELLHKAEDELNEVVMQVEQLNEARTGKK